MINFESIFRNYFDTPKISDNNLQKFTEDNINRIIANNGGGTFNSILADTNAAYTNYFGKMSSEAIAFAVQQSLTQSVDILIANFKDDASRYEGAVVSKYGKTSPVIQEFYPLGVTEYRQSNKSNVKLLMTRIAAAFSNHSTDFDAAVVTLFSNYPTNFQTGRDAQLQKIGTVSTDKVGTAAGRDALETQLMKNIFFVGFNFPGNVAHCMAFFNQAILRTDIDPDNDGKGQVDVFARLSGTPVADAEFEFVGTGINKFHTGGDGKKRSPKVPAPGTYTLRGTIPGHAPIDKSITVSDAGISNVDFDF